ncbi:MAG: YcgN family cysteine cluster protein [Pseudomonadales bacterium]
MRAYFWEHYTLSELSDAEWEALCDGCGKCCLKKFTDIDTEEVLHTSVACHKLNIETCRCRSYARRHAEVPDCIDVRADMEWSWLPATCAYRLRALDKPLFDWHPLVSGSPASVHTAGISVRGNVLSEENVHPDELEQHIVHWVE